MYEQVSHALLNETLDRLDPEIKRQDLRHFYTRLGANFYAIYSLFHHLYGDREDFTRQLTRLIEVMASQYIERDPVLRQSDIEREKDHNWFLRQEWVGMALYIDGFAGDLQGLRENLSYLQELGINMVHVMPILECPEAPVMGAMRLAIFAMSIVV